MNLKSPNMNVELHTHTHSKIGYRNCVKNYEKLKYLSADRIYLLNLCKLQMQSLLVSERVCIINYHWSIKGAIDYGKLELKSDTLLNLSISSRTGLEFTQMELWYLAKFMGLKLCFFFVENLGIYTCLMDDSLLID